MCINYHILKFFFEANRLSSCRLYMVLKAYFSGHLHRHEFPILTSELNCSNSKVFRLLKQLEELNVIIRVSKTYWRLSSWHEFTESQKSKRITFSNLPDVKVLRTSFYEVCYRRASYWSRKNNRPLKSTMTATKIQGPRFVPVSASFVDSVTNINRTAQTINAQCNKARTLGFSRSFVTKKIMEITPKQQFSHVQINFNAIVDIFKSYTVCRYEPRHYYGYGYWFNV